MEMEQERKWFSWRSIFLTMELLFVLMLVIWIEICLFISGPNLRYVDKIETQIQMIRANHQDIQDIHRHVFSYVIYSGHDEEQYYWFNERGEVLTTRKMDEVDISKAEHEAKNTYKLTDYELKIGYGYDNPVYIIENKDFEIYLDMDTMKRVFYRIKGEVQ